MQSLKKAARRGGLSLGVVAVLGICGCGNSQPQADGSAAPQVSVPADPSTLVLKAETALPPGQSGLVTTTGQAQGLLSSDPGAYGTHIDDQRLLYWGFKAKPATLGGKPGTPMAPKDGVQVYRDDYGVPIVYANNVRDLWYGVGYAIAQDRLFLMDAVRRTAEGTLAELTGCGALPADLQQRVITYSAAE